MNTPTQPKDENRSYWLKVRVWLYHILAFQLWFFIGPSHAIKNTEKVGLAFIWLFMGILAMSIPVQECNKLVKGTDGGVLKREDALFDEKSPTVFGIIVFSLFWWPGMWFVLGPGRYDEVIPVFQRFLTIREILVFGIASGLFTYYSSFYVCRRILVFGATWSSPQVVVRNIALYSVFLLATVTMTVVCIAASSILVRLLIMLFCSAVESGQAEIASEHGPGLSRAGPYAVGETIGFLLLGVASIFAMFIVPMVCSLSILRKLKERFSQL